MRIKFYILEQRDCPWMSDPEHTDSCFRCHELYEHSGYSKLEDAQKELIKITDHYARIEKHTEEYTPPPAGMRYKKERLGWSTERTEVIQEN